MEVVINVWIEAPFDNLPLEGYRPQRYWLMAQAFIRAGHSVVLWTSDFNHTTKVPRLMEGDFFGSVVPVEFIPTRPYAKNVSLARFASHRAYADSWERLARAAVSSGRLATPDLVIVSLPPIATAAVARRICRDWKAAFVMDMQDAWPETFERLFPRGLRGLARVALAPLSWRVSRACRAAALVTGVCDRYEALVKARGALRYARAYLGIELDAPPPARPPSAALRLVYAGNLGRSYDLGTVLSAIRSMKEVTLDIAGKGPCERKWRAQAKGLMNVRFHGYLGREDLARLLRTCDAGLVPMADDTQVGLPNKFFDYAAAGIAIVSSLGGESARLLARHGAGAVYRAGDAASLVTVLEGLRQDVAARGFAARKLAEEEFDATTIYDDYVKAVCTQIANPLVN